VEEGQLPACLNIIKSGLFSSNPEVVIWCARLITKIGTEIGNLSNQLSGESWDWFTDSSKPMKHIRELDGRDASSNQQQQHNPNPL
jgi:hypothetical protein